MLRLLIAAPLLIGVSSSHAQDIDLPISPRVDTTQAEVAEVYHLWRDYLGARPDSARANAFWSATEQARYPDFDVSRRWTYGYVTSGFTIHDGLGIRPRVLSIEPDPAAGGAYAVRTLYAPDDLSDFQGLFSVQRVYARREGDEWRLSNALPVLTRSWERRRVGVIEYVFPSGHPFDEAAAQRAAAFADSVEARFGLALDGPIEYYVAPTASEMARISGLDYSWDPNDGRAYAENRQVFVGTGREDYLHELAHALFGPLDTVQILDEGLATYLGGFGTRTFEEAADDTAERLRALPDLRLDDVLRGAAPDAETYYVTGAVLVEAAVVEGGPDALRRFLALAQTSDGVYDGLREVLGVRPVDADAYWRRLVFAHENA